MVIKQVSVCDCRDRDRVGYSLRTVTNGGGIGFLAMLALGLLKSVSMDCTS